MESIGGKYLGEDKFILDEGKEDNLLEQFCNYFGDDVEFFEDNGKNGYPVVKSIDELLEIIPERFCHDC